MIETMKAMRVGTYLLEMYAPRAGDVQILKTLTDDARIGVGVNNHKHAHVECCADIPVKLREAVGLFGRERLLVHLDCGFETFAENPLTTATIGEAKPKAIIKAADSFN